MKSLFHSSVRYTLIAFIIVGCATDQSSSIGTHTPDIGVTSAVTVRRTSEAIEGEWAFQRECAPPCWHGITPGATTRDQARRILQSTPQFTNLQEYESLNGFDWRLSGSPQTADGTKPTPVILVGEAVFREKDGEELISRLSIPLRGRHDLAAIVDHFGEPPSHVLVTIDWGYLPTDRPKYSLRVLWLDMGLDILQFGVSSTQQDMRSIEFGVAVNFFEASIDAWVESWSGSPELVQRNLVPWNDSYSFTDYCLHAASAEELDRGACKAK